jgi:hypothetical protein
VSMANMISLCFLAAAWPCKVRAVGEVGLSRALNRSVPDPHAPNFTQLHYRLICISSDLRSVCLHQSIKRMIIWSWHTYRRIIVIRQSIQAGRMSKYLNYYSFRFMSIHLRLVSCNS